MRDMKKTLEQDRNRKHSKSERYYDLTAKEMFDLMRYDDKLEAIMDAFEYGYILGHRSAENEAKKKRA